MMKSIYFIFLAFLVSGCDDSDLSENEKFLQSIRRDRTKEVVQFLVKNPNLLHQKTGEDSLTALHLACMESDAETVKLLLDKGAKIGEVSKNGNTCLHFAFENFMESHAVMLLLLENKADLSIKNLEEKDIWTYIFTSKKNGFKFYRKESDLLALLMRFDYLPDTTTNVLGKNILHELSERSESPEITEFLVEKHKMNPDFADVNGWTPLHYASKGRNYEVARILIKNGANVNAQTTKSVGTSSKSRWTIPEGSTPWDVYMKQSHSNLNESMSPLFEKYGGKRQKDL